MKNNQPNGDNKIVALYHVIYAHETFEDGAQAIMDILIMAENKEPGRPRALYLDIDEHRNQKGGFDADMHELQSVFLMSMVFPYVTRIKCPLYDFGNKNPQRNDVPASFFIANSKKEAEQKAKESKMPVVLTDGNDFVPKEENK